MEQLMDIRPVILGERALHRIENGRGLAVTCFEGAVWITQENDPRDIVLNAGQSAVLDRNGTAIVFAFKEAAILVGTPVTRANDDHNRAHAA